MTPEEKARVLIDQMFVDAGWKVVSRDEYSADTSAAAIEEGILQGGKEADYLLFINGMAVGVLEAKKETTDVSSDKVTSQAENYTRLLLPFYKTWSKPLPLVYTSNGHMVLFRDHRDPDGGYIPMKRIHTPKEICQILGIEDEFAGLPTLKKKGLRDCKHIFYNKQNYFCDIWFTALCNTMKSDLSHFVIRKTTEYRTFLKKNCYLCRS